MSTLKESLVLRDKELHLLHRQPNSTAGIAKQINGTTSTSRYNSLLPVKGLNNSDHRALIISWRFSVDEFLKVTLLAQKGNRNLGFRKSSIYFLDQKCTS